MAQQAVTAQGIEKHYGKTHALRGIDIEVERGEIFGLIGADGSGKTSLFRILTTLLLPDGGNATVDGFDVVTDFWRIRKLIGYMPGRFSLYQDLTVQENLNFFATVFNTSIQENYELIKDIWIQLEPFCTRRAGALSGGMKQKLALCCALIHRPSVLFLDEPTTGVDPVSRKEFWNMLGRLKQEGISILVSTPYMDEAAMCNRLALISDGSILETGTPYQISSGFPHDLFSIKAEKLNSLIPILQSHPSERTCFSFGSSIHFSTTSGAVHCEEIATWLGNHGQTDVFVERINPSIEDRFLALSATGDNQ
ncbi:ABC-type multidrug transport system, ATPase component [Sphaerochaeta pleomorpha str. Grapes]|uniref:ABC-type multidrug transport system, ATPase component n=1 Tax=Sphaerochaeta pleomorpha (strain ATCC BAA-1885 / DSM 22778 / Grapes) TaxID=158190 RepID=G8QX68_SPHPG|nr:ABC transporter ATP-binding protein [Sphaerochaeta pleomorpha]AEV30653.1 ABC-type multidrug transport system, ATPase component [Sphaerochaeta pleomorpha str. Grapes]